MLNLVHNNQSKVSYTTISFTILLLVIATFQNGKDFGKGYGNDFDTL